MHPEIQNYNPRYKVDLHTIEVGTIAMTAVIREFLKR